MTEYPFSQHGIGIVNTALNKKEKKKKEERKQNKPIAWHFDFV